MTETDSSFNIIDDSSKEISTMFNDLFTTSNVFAIIFFLGVYFVLYKLLGFFFNKQDTPSGFNINLSRSMDIVFVLILLIIMYSVYVIYKNDPDSSMINDFMGDVFEYIDSPASVISTSIFIVVFYLVATIFQIPMSKESKPIFMYLIESIAWLLLIITIFVEFFKYTLNLSIYDLFPMFGTTPNDEPEIVPSNTIIDPSNNIITDSSNNVVCETTTPDDPEGEVFNISKNIYTYKEANAVCKSFDAKLATYDQVESAYNNGAEWCNYGWSDGQMILFPTQKNTWKELQKLDEKRECNSNTPSYKNACGRPGINGGYIANPYVKFGVNCFGKKPDATENDIARLNQRTEQTYPKSREEYEMESKINKIKQQSPEMLQLSSYNTKQWKRTG